MDWVQWYSAVVAVVLVLGLLARLKDGETRVREAVLTVLVFSVPFARVFKIL